MIPRTTLGRAFLAVILSQAVIIIFLEAYISASFETVYDTLNELAKPVPVYLGIFILAQIFQLLLCWDALINENTMQVIALVLFSSGIAGYSVFQFFQLTAVLDPKVAEGDILANFKALLISVPAVSAFYVMAIYGFCYKLYHQFGWNMFKKIGADPSMKCSAINLVIYRNYQFFLLIVKMDVFFVLAFGIQFLALVIQVNDPEFYITAISMPIVLLLLLFAVTAVFKIYLGQE